MSVAGHTLAYVELHAHSAFSFGDGASQPDEMATAAAELGHAAMALTDHDSLSGALEFAHAARAVDLKPITGAELTVVDDLERTAHVTVIVRTAVGYRNLCQLITGAYRARGGLALASAMGGRSGAAGGRSGAGSGAGMDPEASMDAEAIVASWGSVPPGRVPNQKTRIQGTPERPNPLVTLDDLCTRAEGLIVLTGCASHGLLLSDLRTEQHSRAVALTRRLHEAFGRGNCFVELQLAFQRGDALRNRELRAVAQAAGVPVVATGNVHAHDRARGRLHEALVAIRNRTTLEACEGERAGNLALVLRSPQDMARRFRDHPDAVRATVEIADRIEFDLTQDLGYRYPVVAVDGMQADDYLGHLCRDELQRKYLGRGSHNEAAQRLTEELRIIRHHGLAGFFLLHRDVLELAREVALDVRGRGSIRMTNPPGRGRGSSVESIVCYLTGLSHVDPVESGLKMGRFLNEEMPSAPDIDLDFPRDIRHELLKRVVGRYGQEKCAMVAAHATYKTKGAIRDLGMALGLPAADLARVATRCDAQDSRWVGECVDREGVRWETFKRLCTEISGLPRQIGQHSGGVIVSTDPLDQIVPIQPTAMAGRQICQWDKDSCGDAGFLKIDVLGLGMLSVVEECAETIALSGGKDVDLSRIDYAEEAIYDEIGRGDTVGTFQIESRAQIQSVKRVKPRNLHDLAIQIALIRPGPIIGNSVNQYVALREAQRKDPTARPVYDHPLLEPVLEETAGAIIFQDQVIEVAMAIGAFTAGEADGLRRAMSRKRSAGSVEVWRPRFMEGALQQGIDPATAEKIFNRLIGFASYGFPRAHSVAFAILAYQSQWLRHHYPAHFVCALINAQPMGFYTPDSLLRDSGRHGVTAHAIDINLSDTISTVLGMRDMRIGIQHVKGLAWKESVAIVEERTKRGPFLDIEDLARRAPVRINVLEALVRAGVTESLLGSRREQLWQLGLVARPRHHTAGTQGALDIAAPDSPEFAQLSLLEEVAADFQSTGMSVRAHPVEIMRDMLPAHIVQVAECENVAHKSVIEIVGAVVARQRPPSAKGVLFLLLEDESGSVNVVVHPKLYQRQRVLIRAEAILRIKGRVERHDDVVNLIAIDVARIPKKLGKAALTKPIGKFYR